MIRSPNQDLTTRLCELVRARAAEYFPQFQGRPLQVKVRSHRRRQFAELFTIQVKANGEVANILAKMVLPASQFNSTDVADANAARLISTPDPIGSEFRAMSAFAREVERASDARLFAVRVLDSVFDDRVLLLEMVQAKSLDRHLLAAARWGASGHREFLQEAIGSAGACLRTLHAMPCGDSRRRRGTTRAEFIEWVEAAERFAAEDKPSKTFFSGASRRLIALAEDVLNEHLPIGPVHDDFAPRNVLVNDRGQVALIDMLQEWSGCVWEDMGRFLAAIDANKLQALSGGRAFSPARTRALRETFLSGYYEDEAIPRAEIALFEAQTILSQWAAQQHRLTQSRRWRGSLGRLRFAASRRWLETTVKKCLTFAEQAAGDTATAHEPQALVVGGAT